MRKHLALSLAVLSAIACDPKTEGIPPLPPAQVGPAALPDEAPSAQPAAAPEVDKCPDAACEAACAGVMDDIRDDCPAAWVAGCFSGTAPADYPCKLFLRAATDGPQDEPAVPAAVDEPETERKPALKAAPPLEGILKGGGKVDVLEDESGPKAKPTPIGD